MPGAVSLALRNPHSMNYLAHGWRFTDDPYFLAGTAAPDWLSVINRKVRLRSRTAAQFITDADATLAAFARGVVQHHTDDAWFHATPAFNSLSLAFSVEIRDVLPGDEGFRPSFLGHILVELLLDRVLTEEEPERLDAYYAALAAVDAEVLQSAVNRLATQPTDKITALIPRFLTERFLYDYLDDAKLLTRLNHVMRRVTLPQLPEALAALFPSMLRRVREQSDLLLAGTKTGPGELCNASAMHATNDGSKFAPG
jgi:hypothetical protein